MYAPFHSSRAVCTPGRCSGAWSLLFYKKGTCLSRGFHQLFTKEWGGRGVLPSPAFPFFSAPYPPAPLPRRGRGRFLVYFAGGFAPGTPAFNRLRHLQSLPSRCPAGACPVGRLPTLPFAFFFPPIPPTPFPDGEGGDQGYFMQGASPLASPRLNPWLPQKRQEAVPHEQCRQPRRGGTGGDGTIRRTRRRRLRWSSPPGQIEQVPRGACFLCCLPTLPSVYFFCPLFPRPPSPVGKGEPKVISCKGLRPLHPRG